MSIRRYKRINYLCNLYDKKNRKRLGTPQNGFKIDFLSLQTRFRQLENRKRST